MKKRLTSWQMILLGFLAILLQRLPQLVFGYTIGSSLGLALGLVGLASIVLGVISLIGTLIRKIREKAGEKNNQKILGLLPNFFGIMPDSDKLSKHFWHRLVKVLWLISVFMIICLILGSIFLVEGEGFGIFIGAVVIGSLCYFIVPIIYRGLLYIFTGNSNGEKK